MIRWVQGLKPVCLWIETKMGLETTLIWLNNAKTLDSSGWPKAQTNFIQIHQKLIHQSKGLPYHSIKQKLPMPLINNNSKFSLLKTFPSYSSRRHFSNSIEIREKVSKQEGKNIKFKIHIVKCPYHLFDFLFTEEEKTTHTTVVQSISISGDKC